MLIVAGTLEVDPLERDAYVAGCEEVVRLALAAPGCADFAITADSLDPSRIRIYERWASREELMAFRGSGPSGEQQAQIRSADVRKYAVDPAG